MTESTIVILAGGLSHEREVSLRSGRRVAQALRDTGQRVVEADVDAKLVSTLRGISNPVVFPLLHGGAGEDGALREVLELLQVPYVGSTGAACRVAFDKSIATAVVRARGIETPSQVSLPHDVFRELGAAELMRALGETIGFPMMVKPAEGGSALGCYKVSKAEELPAAMVAAYGYGTNVVVESFVPGTEVAVTVLDSDSGPRALPVVEIRPNSGIYDYAARYTAGETRFICPTQLPEAAAAACAEMAVAVHRHLGLDDISRTDIIVRSDGTPVFLEANVAPGMTETSLVPLALEAAGLDLGSVCAELVERARTRGVRREL